MLDQDEIDRQRELLAIHRRTLAEYLKQQAILGPAQAPPSIAHAVGEARAGIRRIKGALRGWGLPVEDYPDDEPPGALGAARPTSIEAMIDLPGDIVLSGDAELAPFVAGPPVAHPRRFFGRERELRRLFGLWRQRPLQNAAIIGPRRSGKTSLLLHLKQITTIPSDQLRPGQRADWLAEPARYRWIFVDFQDPRMEHQDVLLRYLLARMELPVPGMCNLERFIDIVARGLRTPTVILLDEIGVALERYPELDDTFWEGLRALASNQAHGNLAFVLATHQPPDQLAHHTGRSSPFFNIFGYTTVLGPLTEPEARALIASSPLTFLAEDVEWILAQSGRWPILLQVLCRERLAALEDGETGDEWRAEGLRQIGPFRHLLTQLT